MKHSSTQDSNSPRLKAVHVGISGFPFGSAAINKCLAVYSSLSHRHVDFLIINNRAVHPDTVPVAIQKKGKIEGMDYVYTSLSPYRDRSFFKRNLSNLWGRINEIFLLLKLGLTGQIDVMFYYPTNGSFFEVIFYRTLSKIFNFLLIAHYVEYRTAFVEDINAFDRLKHRWFDKYFMHFVDVVLPISEFLIKQLKQQNYNGPYIKVPPLTDFNTFNLQASPSQEPYFLYVGTAAYLSAIKFITESYELAKNNQYQLHMVVNGSSHHMQEVEKVVQQMSKRSNVKIFSNLKYGDLVRKYIQAKALLIPLTNSVTDIARFPQKISEYLASGNPVITTNYGEIPYYFIDKENALVANDFNVNEFAEKLDFVMEHPDIAAQIGKRGNETGKRYFDLNSYGAEIKNLLLSLQPH